MITISTFKSVQFPAKCRDLRARSALEEAGLRLQDLRLPTNSAIRTNPDYRQRPFGKC